MKLGAYTACLHDKPLADALKTLAGLGLDSAEINSGGFLGTPHLPIDDLRSSETAMEIRLIPIQKGKSKRKISTPRSSWRRSLV